jgi:hypothetical protein
MTIEFIKVNEESPIVEFNYPVDDLQGLFNNYQDWKTNSDNKGLEYKGLEKRLTLKTSKIQDPSVDKFKLMIEESKLRLVETFLNIDTENRWPKIPIPIARQLQVYSSLVTDLVGYKMDQHIDNRSVYAAGYLNVFDNESLTVVSSNKKTFFGKTKESQYRAPGKKGRGIIWLNTENSWHWVNKVSQDRKIIMLSFQIVPWN